LKIKETRNKDISNMSNNEYSEENIPYEGSLSDAMIAHDRDAIRFLMSRRKTKEKTKEEVDVCMICMEKFNKGRRRKVTCPGCQQGCCESCFRRHLLESSSTGSECAGCKQGLSLEFVAGVTPKSFHNTEYRKKRANDLLSQERSLLPVTQLLVIDEKERQEREIQVWELMDEAKYLRFRLGEIRRDVAALQVRTHEKKKKKERKKFIMGCPLPDCRGFLSQGWKCGTCGTHVCSKCRVPKESKNDEAHVCDDGDVATAKLLAKETKPCPKCAVPIFKISGCDQMWCVECKTPFSWKTGMPVTGIIHNPHFYQWQRESNGGVAPRRGQRHNCGGLPWVRTLTIIIEHRRYNVEFPNWERCHRSVGHIRGAVIPRYPRRVGVEDHSDLRLQFLLKDIDEDEWLSKLLRRQKKIEKNQEVHNVLDMYVVTLTDLFQLFTSTHFDLATEANALRDYVNSQLQGISRRYNNVVPNIDPDWLEIRWR
jgi:hypothetical protein